jgi:hypothetical protein
MDNQASRRRTSSTPSSKADMLELQKQLKIFASTLPGQGKKGLQNCHRLVHAGHSIRQLLLETSNSYRAQEVFRHLNGFQAILTAVENISRTVRLDESNIQDYDTIQELIQTVFGVLTAALRDHKGNQKFFRQLPPGGGWQSLRNSFEITLRDAKDKNLSSPEIFIERLFGCLLSCATNEDVLADLFGKLRRQCQGVSSQESKDMSK